MSEVLVPPSSIGQPLFGLIITNEQAVRIVTTDNPADPKITVTGSAGVDSFRADSPTTNPFEIKAGGGNDAIVTSNGNDILSGEAGNDSIKSGGGNDNVTGGLGNDLLMAGDGSDFVAGGDGNDRVSGDAGNDRISGEGGNDVLSGGDGNDLLTPGAGRDLVRGGAGRDRFRFEKGSTGGEQLDRIADFTPQDDVIEISRSLLPGSGLAKGTLKESDFQIVEGIGSADASAKIVYESSSGIVYYNPAGGVDVKLFKMQKGLDVSAADFKIF
jgi:Ca2+-binding RTX toxin-like protein